LALVLGVIDRATPATDHAGAPPKRERAVPPENGAMTSSDTVFSGSMAEFYDRRAGSMFAPYAADMASRLSGLSSARLLEVAAGTGIVTQALARVLPDSVKITATDLSRPFLDFAAGKPDLARVAWREADAMALPFTDDVFDVVVCQFGIMFFPDKPRAHAEARRVLRPGGRYLFSAWDSLAANPDAEIVERAVAALYPAAPIGFIRRTPFGYFDLDRIRADLHAGGFESCTIDTVALPWQTTSAWDVATGYCHGTPMRAEIEAAAPQDGIARATEAAAAALIARFGEGPYALPRRALVVEAKK
jgi:SAM-dependent methyltransferase